MLSLQRLTLSVWRKINIKESPLGPSPSGDSSIPGPIGTEGTAPRLLLGQDLRDIGDYLLDLFVLEIAFLERVVCLDGVVGVQNDRHLGVLGDFVGLRSGGIVDAKN